MGQPHSGAVGGDLGTVFPKAGGSESRGGDRDRIEVTIRTKPAVYQVASLSLSIPDG